MCVIVRWQYWITRNWVIIGHMLCPLENILFWLLLHGHGVIYCLSFIVLNIFSSVYVIFCLIALFFVVEYFCCMYDTSTKKTDFVFHIRLFFCDKNCFLTCNDTYICIRDMPYFNFCFCLVTNHDVFVSFVCLMIIKSVWGELEVSISVISFDCLQYLVYMN